MLAVYVYLRQYSDVNTSLQKSDGMDFFNVLKGITVTIYSSKTTILIVSLSSSPVLKNVNIHTPIRIEGHLIIRMNL